MQNQAPPVPQNELSEVFNFTLSPRPTSMEHVPWFDIVNDQDAYFNQETYSQQNEDYSSPVLIREPSGPWIVEKEESPLSMQQTMSTLESTPVAPVAPLLTLATIVKNNVIASKGNKRGRRPNNKD